MMKSNRGFALSIVLWIVFIIMLSVAILLNFAKDNAKLTTELNNKLLAQLEAQSLLEELKYYILMSDFDHISFINNLSASHYNLPKQLYLDNREYQLTPEITLQLRDTSSMINLLYAPSTYIANSLTSFTQRQTRFVLQDTLDDWRDSDNIVRLNGAEDATYQHKRRESFHIRNMDAVQDISELHLIQGYQNIDTQSWNDLSKKSYVGPGASTNLLLLDATELSALLKITPSQARSLIHTRQRDQKLFQTLVKSKEHYDEDAHTFSISRQLVITINVTHGAAHTELQTLINFKTDNYRPYSIITYKQN